MIFFIFYFVFCFSLYNVFRVNLKSVRGGTIIHVDAFNSLPYAQVNIGILISVTRIISRISGENYKVHGDANAVK